MVYLHTTYFLFQDLENGTLDPKDMPCLHCKFIEMGEMACYTKTCPECGRETNNCSIFFVNKQRSCLICLHFCIGLHLWIWEVPVQDCCPNANLNVLEETKISWKMRMPHIFNFHQLKKNLIIFAPQAKHQQVHPNKKMETIQSTKFQF